MTQRASVYTLRLRPAAPLGDLRDRVASALDGFTETTADGRRSLHVVAVAADGDDVFAELRHGEAGVAAEIADASGALQLQRTPDDVQLVRCACLFRLPAAVDAGSLALHVNDGRGPKELLEAGLRTRLDGVRWELGRPEDEAELREAVAAKRVEKVKLVRVEQPGTRTIAAVDKWVPAGAARVELDVGGSIEPALIGRHLAGDVSAFPQIVEFGGLEFAEAKVQVRLADDSHRVFDLTHPGQGRPVTHELTRLDYDAGGEPTAASLKSVLVRLL